MIYLWLKAFHIAAVVTWIGGMLVTSLAIQVLSRSAKPRPPATSTAINAVRRWDRQITSPAMLLVWGLGLTMAVQADWFSSSWLIVKLVIVVGLSALHGALSGTLRRMAGEPDRSPPAFLRFAAPLTIAAVVAIAVLVVVKPF